MTPSEIFSAISLVVSAAALVYTAKSVSATRRAAQLQLFHSIFQEIKKLDQDYIRLFRNTNTRPSKDWCFDFFNTLEYLAFLLNHGLIEREGLSEFYDDAVRHWHRTFNENTDKKDLDDPDFYPEFKRLHRQICA